MNVDLQLATECAETVASRDWLPGDDVTKQDWVRRFDRWGWKLVTYRRKTNSPGLHVDMRVVPTFKLDTFKLDLNKLKRFTYWPRRLEKDVLHTVRQQSDTDLFYYKHWRRYSTKAHWNGREFEITLTRVPCSQRLNPRKKYWQ